MALALNIDKTLRERRRINRLLDFLKRDDLTGEQMERIGRRLQKSGRRALNPLVRKLWREQDGTALYRYTCMLDFFDASVWVDQLIQITLQRKDLAEDGKLALLDVLHDSGIDVTAPPFASMTGYGSPTLEGFVDDCLGDGERGLVRFVDSFLDVADTFRQRMMQRLSDTATAEAAALLEILLSFEKREVVREAVGALGRSRNGYALDVLTRAAERCAADAELSAAISRSIRRLSFTGVTEALPLPQSFRQPLPFHQVYAGPVDFYGSRTLWFSWRFDDTSFAAMLILTGETDGMLNAISYRMRDEKEYGHILKDVAGGEMLSRVEPEYALAALRDSLNRSREAGFFLPPDFYVDMRLFRPDSLKPEAYIPRFKLKHLETIVEKIPGYVTTSNELLDEPGMEGWVLTETALYDIADRFNDLEADGMSLTPEVLEQEISRSCEELIVPRRAEIIKRLLLTADYLQQIDSDDATVQMTLATALSLVGGLLPDCRHPFVRRLLLDSIDAARQTLAEGYDPRLEEGSDDDDYDD